MKERLLHGWDAMRLLRAAFALMFLFAAVTRHEPIAWFAAALFGFQALFNVGCCGVNACAPTRSRRPMEVPAENVSYEEVR